jgi:hypothetical protein
MNPDDDRIGRTQEREQRRGAEQQHGDTFTVDSNEQVEPEDDEQQQGASATPVAQAEAGGDDIAPAPQIIPDRRSSARLVPPRQRA